MVPVMVVAPHVMKGQIGWVIRQVGKMISSARNGGKQTAVPAGFDGMAVEIPADADGAKRYIVSKEEGLVEKDKNGVTIVSRPEAAE
jgi:multidrug efflux pump